MIQQHSSWSERIRLLRSLRGWSQQRMGEKLGVHGRTVSAWERNLNEPLPAFQEKILQWLREAETINVGRT